MKLLILSDIHGHWPALESERDLDSDIRSSKVKRHHCGNAFLGIILAIVALLLCGSTLSRCDLDCRERPFPFTTTAPTIPCVPVSPQKE
jgi:hypothetical protein